MKCKCGHVEIAHKEFHKMCEEKDCDCKQFTPSEEVCPTRKKGKKCNVCDSLENKGCSKCKGMGVYHSPSCSNNSPRIPIKAVKGLINALEDVKRGRYEVISNNSSLVMSKDKEPDDGGARTDSCSDFKLSDGVFTMEIKGQLCDFLFKGDIKEFIRRLKDKFCCGGEESCELWCKEIDKLSGFGEKNG